jgi:chemotaxis protein MotB
LKNAAHIDPSEASATPSPEENDRQRSYGARFKEDRKFSLASASLRQTLQEMPEITEVSKHIMLEETKQGLNIEIVDQDGRSMFPDGAKEPFERARKITQKIAPQLKAMPYRLSIVGHTAKQSSAKARIWPMGIVG